MMEKALSNKISVVSLLCTFLVVWRHSTNMVAFYGGYTGVPEWLSYTEWSFSRLTDIAVPMFFIISGYFFFRTDYGNLDSYGKMIIKKLRSLLIPFIIWNVIGFFILLGCHVISMPASFPEFAKSLLLSNYNGALWYVRNLIIMMTLVPVYGFMFHRRGGLFFLIPVLLVLLYIWWPIDCSITSYEGWLFFLIGGVLQKYAPTLKIQTNKLRAMVLGIVWLALCLCYRYGGVLMAKSTILLGIISFWCLCDYIPQKWVQKMCHYAKYSFFIYVSHIFVMKTLKVGTAHFFFKDDYAALVAYLIIPIVCFICLLNIGIYLNRYSPTVFMYLTGGRGSR